MQDEEFVTNMSQLLETSKRSYGDIKKRVVWELIKYEIRKYCIKYGKQKRKNTNLNTGNLLKSLNELESKLGTDPSAETHTEYEEVKEQLKQIEFERSNSAIVRSNAQWVEEGEKATRYLFSLENKTMLKNTFEN